MPERQLRIFDLQFRSFDRDHSGGLSRSEFQEMYRLAEKTSPKLAEATLKRLDKNHDGFITSAEAGKEWQILSRLDKNRDGRLSRQELLSLPDLSGDRDFDAADPDKDGNVDFAEFSLWLRTQRKIAPNQ
jgi:Ca2+-binding EF-hand superfamily protein